MKQMEQILVSESSKYFDMHPPNPPIFYFFFWDWNKNPQKTYKNSADPSDLGCFAAVLKGMGGQQQTIHGAT